MSLLDDVQQRLGPSEITKISQQLGVDEGAAQQAVRSALPSMVAGMAGHAQTPAGASTMEETLGGLGNLGGGAGAAGGLLGKIFGQHQDAVHSEVKTKTGLDSGKVASLLSMLAPIVLSALANHGQQQATGPGGIGMGGLGGLLAREAQSMHHNANGGGGGGGLLGQVLSRLG